MYDKNNISCKSNNKSKPSLRKGEEKHKQGIRCGKSKFSKGKGKMFQSDIDTRKNAIESDKLEETKRHNKAQESISKTTGIMQGVGSIVRGLNPFKVTSKLGNHPSWYLQDTSLAQQSTAISDKIPIGKNQEVIQGCSDVGSQPTKFSDSQAVLAIYDYVPVVSLFSGFASSSVDVLSSQVYDKAPNYISKALYTAVKQACRRNLYYSPSDVIRTILIVMDIFCNIEVMKRVYRVANTFQFINQTVGDTLLTNLGFDPEEIRPNLADLLFRINRLGKMLATVRIPQGQTLFNRWMLMASAVFKDRDCQRTRLFAFRKRVGYVNVQGQTYNNIPKMAMAQTMEGLRTEQASVDPGTHLYSYKNVLTFIETQIYSLLNNSDILSCLADINTAFEGKGFWEFQPLGADETQEFGYDEIMISQIRNAVVTGLPYTYFGDTFNATSLYVECFDMYDVGNGNIIQGPAYQNNINPVVFESLVPSVAFTNALTITRVSGSFTPRIGIDTPVDSPDAGILLTVSRLCPTMEDTFVFDSNKVLHAGRLATSHGTEILIGVQIVNVSVDATSQSYVSQYYHNVSVMTRSNLAAWASMQVYNAVPRVLFCDMRMEVEVSGSEAKITIVYNTVPVVMGDMTHVVYCDNTLIDRWHFIAVASEFAIPNVIKV